MTYLGKTFVLLQWDGEAVVMLYKRTCPLDKGGWPRHCPMGRVCCLRLVDLPHSLFETLHTKLPPNGMGKPS